MERLEELKDKFPGIPRNIILKIDALREGIRYTPILNEIGSWALPDMPYAVDHMDETFSSGIMEAQEGWVNIPYGIMFRDGTLVKIQLDKKSPYEIRYEGDGAFMLYRDATPVEEILFIPRPAWFSKKTRKGTLMSTVMSQLGDTYV